MKEHAIIWCRISDLKQEDGFSLDAQERHGQEYCDTNKLIVDKVYRVVETGSKVEKRNKFNSMLKELRQTVRRSGTRVHLIVEKPDRLTRNFTNKEELEALVKAGKLVIHYYKDRRIVDHSCTPAEMFADDIIASASKYIAQNIARETKKGMMEKASQGWYPAHAPLGYKNMRSGEENKYKRKFSTIVVDEETKAAVLRIFELRGLHRYSFGAIRERIIEERLLPPKKLKTFHISTIEFIIKNPFYAGEFQWQGQTFKGKHELFVPPKLIELTQESIRNSSKHRPAGVFSNFLTCAHPGCGCGILYDPKTKKLATTGATVSYPYYHCSDGRHVHKRAGTKQININENKLWEEFSKPVSDISINERMADAISTALKKNHDKAVEAHKRSMQGYRQCIEAKELEEDRATSLLMEGTLDKEAYKRTIDKIRKEKREFENLLEQGQIAIAGAFYETSEKILELAKSAESLWKSVSAEERLKFLKSILSNQQLDGVSLRYTLKRPFAVLAEMKKKDEWCLGPESNRHDRVTESQDFKSCASTNFATEAFRNEDTVNH